MKILDNLLQNLYAGSISLPQPGPQAGTIERKGWPQRGIFEMTAWNKRGFYREMIAIAIPVAIQNIITVGVSMADTVMLGSLGETPLSASALANQLFFIFTLVMFGTSGGTNVLAAQFWGKRDIASIKKVLGYTYRLVLAVAALMTVISALFPTQILSLFTNEEPVIAEGARYLRVISASFFFFGLTTITSGMLRAVQNVRVSMAASVVSVGLNIFLN